MKIPTASSATSSQRGQTSLRSLMPRLPRSNVYSMRDPENPSASVHRKRFLTPSLALKFLCTGELNPRCNNYGPLRDNSSYFVHLAPPSCAGVKVKPCGCCATLTPLVVVARSTMPAPRKCRFRPTKGIALEPFLRWPGPMIRTTLVQSVLSLRACLNKIGGESPCQSSLL